MTGWRKRTIMEMAREAWAEAGEGWVADAWFDDRAKAFEAFAALVCADEREACEESLAHPEQEPSSVQQAYAMAQVCLDLHDALGCKWGDNVYLTISKLKAAAQRPWVGLTFAEICECESEYLNVFARAIEAKLKEKNHG